MTRRSPRGKYSRWCGRSWPGPAYRHTPCASRSANRPWSPIRLASASLFHDLRAAGCQTTLDQCGSGMAAFTLLRRLQPDYLKIAGHIVRGLARDPVHRALATALNEVGHAMGLKTIGVQVQGPGSARVPAPYRRGLWAGLRDRAARAARGGRREAVSRSGLVGSVPALNLADGAPHALRCRRATNPPQASARGAPRPPAPSSCASSLPGTPYSGACAPASPCVGRPAR